MLNQPKRNAPSNEAATTQSSSMVRRDSAWQEAVGGCDSDARGYLEAVEPLAWIAGSLAHDLNNLLTTVMGNLSMAMLEVPSDNPAQEMLKEAAHAVTQASSVTRHLQEFGRRQPTNRISTSLSELVDNLLPTLEQLAGPNIYIRTLHETDAGIICVDPHHFEMILSNLVRNAQQAMRDGGTLVIETSNVSIAQKRLSHGLILTPGDYVAMRLIDHGCGMDPQAIGRLFLPFFTTKPQGRGSGLGLAAIRAALRQAGGGIEVTSAVDAGTTVTVYFPQLRHSEVIEVPKVRQLPPALPNDSTQTILLVEDEPALRSLGQKILARLGYRVLAAANGCEAMEVAANYPFHIDLLFTDVIMPGMNGRELSERLSLERPDMKVLFTSGYTERVFACASVGEQNDASLAGRHLDCLSKPYKPEVLAARIQRILEASQPADPAITTPK